MRLLVYKTSFRGGLLVTLLILPCLAVYAAEFGVLRGYAVLIDPLEINAQNQSTIQSALNSMPDANTKNRDAKRTSAENRPEKGPSRSLSRPISQATDNIYGPVIRGDTLSSIARRILPSDIDLNQMLVALFQENQDAFIANNMNLLRVGAVLEIPEKNKIEAIDVSIAKNKIRTQIEDWYQYQNKMATISNGLSNNSIRQSDQVEITGRVDKNSISASDSPEKLLRLSSGAQVTAKSGQIIEPDLWNRLRMMEEDAIARSLALKEANERVAMLEKNIENLKQLLKLKDSVPAQAQINTESISKNETKSRTQLVETINPLFDNNSKADIGTLKTQGQKAPTVQLTTEAAIKDTDITPMSLGKAENRSLIDPIFKNIEYISGALILMFLSYLLIFKRRRTQSKEKLELDDNNADFSSVMKSKMIPMAASQNILTTEASPFLPGNEKDDLTYENMNSYYKDKKHNLPPDRESIYHVENLIHRPELGARPITPLTAGGDESSVNNSQSNNQTIDLDYEEDHSSDGNQSLGKGDEPADFVYPVDLTDDVSKTKPESIRELMFTVDHDAEDKIELSDDPADSQESLHDPDYQLKYDVNGLGYTVSSLDSRKMMIEETKPIELDLTDSHINLTGDQSENKIQIREVMNKASDFKQRQEAVDDKMQLQSMSSMPELQLTDINLDIEDSAEEKDTILELSDDSEHWQEIEIKLDLAKVYQEMDDKEGAKEILEEVILEGNVKQRETARRLLENYKNNSLEATK